MRSRSILCAFAGATLLAAAPPPVSTVSHAPTIQSQLENDPTIGEMFRVLRDDYPDEYGRMVRLIAEGQEAKRSDAEMRQRGFDEMRAFMVAKLPMIDRAPSADLRALGLAYVALMHALQQENVELCARFATSGLRASDTLPPAAMKAMTHANALQLHAVRQAETSPVPARGTLANADAVAFMAAVTKANPAAPALLQDQAKLNGASDQDKCAVGVAIYDGVASLPEAQAAHLTAFIILNAPKS